jgi:hypothetical protein
MMGGHDTGLGGLAFRRGKPEEVTWKRALMMMRFLVCYFYCNFLLEQIKWFTPTKWTPTSKATP